MQYLKAQNRNGIFRLFYKVWQQILTNGGKDNEDLAEAKEEVDALIEEFKKINFAAINKDKVGNQLFIQAGGVVAKSAPAKTSIVVSSDGKEPEAQQDNFFGDDNKL